MATRLQLVQGDRAPSVFISLTNRQGAPINLAGASALLHFRALGSATVKESIPCAVIPGLEVDDGAGGIQIVTTPPYDTPGAGGRLQLDWTPTALDTPGEFEGEVEVTFPNGRNQTSYKVLTFTVREQFA